MLITLAGCLHGCVSSAEHDVLAARYAELQRRYDTQVAIIADQEEALQELQRQRSALRKPPQQRKQR